MDEIQQPPRRKRGRPKEKDRGPNLVPLPGRPVSNVGQKPGKKSLVFDSKLLSKKTTPRSIAEGNYQRKLLAQVLPQLGSEALNQLYQLVQEGNLGAITKALEATGFVQPKSGFSIINDNRVDNRSVVVDQRDGTTGGPVGRRSFEQIARGLAEVREERRLTAGALSLTIESAEPTPEREGSPNKEYKEGEGEGE